MAARTAKRAASHDGSQPWMHQKGKQIQRFGTVRQFPLGFLQAWFLAEHLVDTPLVYA